MTKVSSISPEDVAAQLRHHHFCYRQIEQTIKALERIQALRKNRTWSDEELRKLVRRAA
jgi:hypothetical protein